MLRVREFTEKSWADYYCYLLHFILFIMHEGVTDTKIKLDVLIQIALEHILAQRFKQSI